MILILKGMRINAIDEPRAHIMRPYGWKWMFGKKPVGIITV